MFASVANAQTAFYKEKQLYICGVENSELKSCGVQNNDSLLIEKTASMIGPLQENFDNCDPAFDGPFCDADTLDLSSIQDGYVDHVIYYVDAKQIVKKRVQFTPDPTHYDGRSYTIVNKTPTYAEKQILDGLSDANKVITYRKETFTFQQTEHGDLENLRGITVGELNLDNDNFIIGEQLGCRTASDFLFGVPTGPNSLTCESGVISFLDAAARSDALSQNLIQTAVKKVTDNIETVTIGFKKGDTTVGLSAKIADSKTFTFRIRFLNGSELALDVTPDGKEKPAIVLNEAKTRYERATQPIIFVNKAELKITRANISGAELQNYLTAAGDAGQCEWQVDRYDHTVLYTVTWVNGVPHVEVVSHQAREVGFVVCN